MTNLIFGIISTAIRIVAMVKLWRWFIEPNFAVPHLNVPQIYGASLFIALFTLERVELNMLKATTKETNSLILTNLIYQILMSSTALLGGYLIQHFFL